MPGRDDVPCAFLIDTATAARTRHPGVTTHTIAGSGSGSRVTVALPLSYPRKRRRRYPLLVLAQADDLVGSAIEMARVLASTKELRECIVVCRDDAEFAPRNAIREADGLARIAQWCREHYRVQHGEVAVFGHGRGLPGVQHLRRTGSRAFDHWLATDATTSESTFPEATAEGAAIPALVHGLRKHWATGTAYGSDVMPLSKPLVSRLLGLARPLIRLLRGGSPLEARTADAPSNRHILRSSLMGRDFEIFVTLPEDAALRGRYAAVVALDANTTWSVVSETARRMARAGEIENVVTIGVGVPRAEGDLAFGLRRFEELSPPGDAAVFDDALGRFFTGVFALFGADVRRHFGLAPLFHRFLAEELLPALLASLPIDPARVALLGHSAAGMFVGYALAQPASPFSHFAVLSPGVAIGQHWMMQPDGGLRPQPSARPVLVALGGEERTNAFNDLAGIPQSEHYADALRAATGAPVEFHELPGESHTTVFPRVVPLVLARWFGART